MKLRALLPLLLALLLLAADLAAQMPPPSPPGADRGFRGVTFDLPGDGAHWVRGETYKAWVRPEGMGFVPFFGSDAPRNFPVAFTWLGLASDDELLAGAAPTITRRGTRVTVDRGPVEERYDFAATSVEQSFLVLERPRTGGDLVVKLRIESELAPVSRDGGFDFAHPDFGIVRYGRATAFDADGRKASVSAALDGGVLSLRVAADAVAAARFPLLIDPIVSTQYLGLSTTPSRLNGDVSSIYNYTGPVFDYRSAVIVEEIFSAADHDAFFRIVDEDGVSLSGPITIDLSVDSWVRPRSAANQWARFLGVTDADLLVVAEVHPLLPLPGSGLNSRIGARSFPLDGSTPSTSQIILTDGASYPGACQHPDVGGNANFDYVASPVIPGYFLVVFEAVSVFGDRDIRALLLDQNLAATPLPIAITGAEDFAPAVSKSPGHTGDPGNWPNSEQWTVVWQRRYSPTDHDIHGLTLRADGVPAGPEFSITQTYADETDPDVSTPTDALPQGRKVLVVYSRKPTGSSTRDVAASLVENGAATVLGSISAMADPSTTTLDLRGPVVASDGARFAVAWAVPPTPITAGWSTQVATFRALPPSLVVDDLSQQGFPAAVNPTPAISARFAVAPTTKFDRYLVTSRSRGALGIDDVAVQAYDGRSSSGGITPIATAVGPIGLSHSGAPSLGGYLAFSMFGGTGAANRLLMIGMPLPTPIPVCGSGALGVAWPPLILIDDTMTSPNDPYFEIVLPGEPLLVGLTVAVQAAALGIPGGCPVPIGPNATLDVSFSDTLLVTFQ